MSKGEERRAAPTGCFKCGRPGHWSRDCPSSSASNSNPNPNSDSRPNISTNSFKQPSEAKVLPATAKKVPRSRPKLTPDILLSDDGLGYVLRHFPRAFKYHGPGHEVEQVGASRRVRRCIDQLKERVARGGDPTKLNEGPVELVDRDKEPDQCENERMGVEETVLNKEDPPMEGHDQDHMQEEMINEIFQMATVDSSQPLNKPSETPQAAAMPAEPANHMTDHPQEVIKKIQITEEQRARMEANRLKALERAKQLLTRASQPP